MARLKYAFRGLAIAALASGGLAVAMPHAIAQETDTEAAETEADALNQAPSNIDPLEGLGTDQQGSDTFGETNNPFELIHRALSAPSLTSGEFQAQQRRRISSEAEAFRQRQQEALREASDPQPVVDEIPESGDDATLGDEI